MNKNVNNLDLKQKNNSDISLPELALADKATFARWPLGYDLPKHQEEWCDLIDRHKDLIILAPARHGKSTVFSIINAVHEVTKNRDIRIGLVCNKDSLAKDILREIKWHLENNEDLIRTYGEFKSPKADKWSEWQIMVANNVYSIRRKDATISALGAMSSIKGLSFDLLLGDDIVDEKNSCTAEKCEALWDWLWSTLIPRCMPNASKKFMGTVENELDMYHRFLEDNRGFKIIKQQAIIDENSKRVLWPEERPYEWLAGLRSANYSSFMKTYQNVVVGNEVAKIGTDKINACYDASRVLLPNNIPDEIKQRYKYILMSVDPAWTQKKTSAYAVIMTVGVTHNDEIREILDIFREKISYDGLFQWIKNKYFALLPHLVIVESNQMQLRLAQEVRSAAIPTKPIFTTGRKNDVEVGIPMIYSVIGTQKLKLPTGDKISQYLSQQLMNEILSYPHGQYSDMLMALYFIEQEVRQRSLKIKSDNMSVVSKGRAPEQKFSRRYHPLWA